MMMFITAIENTIAVFRARKSLEDIEQETIQHQNVEDLRVQLLKLANNKEGVTMASCIIETGRTTNEIREVLQELERQDVVRSGNRESDGAVFYRVV